MVARGKVKNKIMGAALSAAMVLTAVPVCGMTSLACEKEKKHEPMHEVPVIVFDYTDYVRHGQGHRLYGNPYAYDYEFHRSIPGVPHVHPGRVHHHHHHHHHHIGHEDDDLLVTLDDIITADPDDDVRLPEIDIDDNTTEEIAPDYGMDLDENEDEVNPLFVQLCDLFDEVYDFEIYFGDEIPMAQRRFLDFEMDRAIDAALNIDNLTDGEIEAMIYELQIAYDTAIDAIDAADAAAQTPAQDTEDTTPDIVIPDRCPTLPEEDDTLYVIYGEQPEDMDLTDVGLIIQDRHPTLPEERTLVIYGEQPEDMDLTDVDLIIQDRCPTLPEERTPVIYGEQPEDMDISNVDLIVPDRYNTNPEDTTDTAAPQDEQTSDFEITTGESITIEAQPEVTEEPEVVAEPETQTPAAETPAPETQATQTQTPETQTVVIVINAAPAAVETTPAPVAQTVVETAAPAAAPAASVSAPAASAAPAGQVLGAARDEASTIDDLVERLYVNALNRNSDLAGKTFWINKILNDDVELGDVVRGFLNSAEFNARNLNDDDFITLLYKVMFNRTPSSKEKSYWMEALANGASRNEIISAFLNSAEFEATYDAYEI